ncbi:MAG: hypothetical protein WCJ64_15785 [Rhodospirillaceae bacterium]
MERYGLCLAFKGDLMTMIHLFAALLLAIAAALWSGATLAQPVAQAATLPLLTDDDRNTEEKLLKLAGSDERLAWLWARGLKPLEAEDMLQKTYREVGLDGAEIVTFFGRDGVAFVRPAPAVPRPESTPGFRWEVRDAAVVNLTTGGSKRYLANSSKTAGWVLSLDARQVRRWEQVATGDFTKEKNLARTVEARPGEALPDPSDLPRMTEEEQALDAELLKMIGGPIEKTLREAGYHRLTPEEVSGLTIEERGRSARARTYYDPSGIRRARTNLTPIGAVYELPWRAYDGAVVRWDTFGEEFFYTKDGRTGFIASDNPVTGSPVHASWFGVVGKGNFVDGWFGNR